MSGEAHHRSIAREKLIQHPEMKSHIAQHGEKIVDKFQTGCANCIKAANLKEPSRIMIITDKAREAIAIGLEAEAKDAGHEVKVIVEGSKEDPLHKDHPRLNETVDLINDYKPNVNYVFADDDAWPGRAKTYFATTGTDAYGFTFISVGTSHKDVYDILSGDPTEVQERTHRLFEHMDKVQKERGNYELYTGSENPFTCKFGEKTRVIEDDFAPPKGEFIPGLKAANLPGGEVETGDPENAEGEVLFQPGSRIGKFGVVKHGITASFAKGMLTDMVAHHEEDQHLVDKMNQFMEEHTRNVIEAAVATNGNIKLEDADTSLKLEKVLGTAHIGVGNEDMHHDLVAKVIDLLIGGEHIIKNGKYVYGEEN